MVMSWAALVRGREDMTSTDRQMYKFGAVQSSNDARKSFIRFGPEARADKSAVWRLYGVDELSGEVTDIQGGPIPRRGRVKLCNLSPVSAYLLVVRGAGERLAETSELRLRGGFYLLIDFLPEPPPPRRGMSGSILLWRSIEWLARSIGGRN